MPPATAVAGSVAWATCGWSSLDFQCGKWWTNIENNEILVSSLKWTFWKVWNEQFFTNAFSGQHAAKLGTMGQTGAFFLKKIMSQTNIYYRVNNVLNCITCPSDFDPGLHWFLVKFPLNPGSLGGAFTTKVWKNDNILIVWNAGTERGKLTIPHSCLRLTWAASGAHLNWKNHCDKHWGSERFQHHSRNSVTLQNNGIKTGKSQNNKIFPVVPRKAVAEVSKIG